MSHHLEITSFSKLTTSDTIVGYLSSTGTYANVQVQENDEKVISLLNRLFPVSLSGDFILFKNDSIIKAVRIGKDKIKEIKVNEDKSLLEGDVPVGIINSDGKTLQVRVFEQYAGVVKRALIPEKHIGSYVMFYNVADSKVKGVGLGTCHSRMILKSTPEHPSSRIDWRLSQAPPKAAGTEPLVGVGTKGHLPDFDQSDPAKRSRLDQGPEEQLP